MRTSSQVVHAVLLAALVAPAGAHARSPYLGSFDARYGTSGTRLDTCNTCHGGSTSTFNPYGDAVAGRLVAGRTIDQAFADVEPIDSDGDGFANLAEIQALAFPGDAADKPATTPTCPDADGDGFAVCGGTCTPAANAQCGDCNDANAAVSPGAAEGPFGDATCADATDNNCDGLVDAADPACAPPESDYDIQAFSAPAGGIVRQALTLTVTVVNAGATNPGGFITVFGQSGRKRIEVARDQVFTAAPGGTATLTFTVAKPRIVGTITWFAIVTDGDPDADEATATTVVTRK